MRFCPYAQRIHLVLDAKNIPYHTVWINLAEKPEWLLAKSALLKVPALEIPGETTTIIESLIIADYLDEKYPEVKLHSMNSLQKARDRILIERFGAVTDPLFQLFFGKVEDTTQILIKLIDGCEIYEDELKWRRTKFFGGGVPGMLDYMLWPWFERFEMYSIWYPGKFDLKTSVPTINEWCEAMIDFPVVKKSYVAGKDHLAFAQTRLAGKPNNDMLADK